jgi:D-glycero-alpha-D-manno-heptose 1-phosphate guanylyltransferase
MAETTAVILAASLGTRLRSVVSDRPKPMAEINGKPFLEYLIKRLMSHGTEHMVICVSYMKEQIIDYFSKNYGSYVKFSI